ncbi:hypothetical protein GF374_03640 [Candidatus Woesearchaeota archaeon]|nr:hypothetical protein [Candidatus Woesearchaeota archaeon]
MGNSYLDLVGTPPDARTSAFREWKDRLVDKWQRYVVSDLPSTIYYFADDGDDEAAENSKTTPYQTLAKAAEVAASGDVILAFRTGDMWQDTSADHALELSQSWSNVHICTWSPDDAETDGRVIITRGQSVDTFTQAGATNRYTATLNTEPDWIYIADDPERILTKESSTADVEANTHSWYWDANVLHVNLGGVDPDDLTLGMHYIVANDYSGIVLNGDQQRLSGNFYLLGFGCHWNKSGGGSNQYGARVGTDSGNLAWIDGVTSLYCSTHALGHNPKAAEGSGGLGLLTNCRAGACTSVDGNDTVTIFNSYASHGAQETIFVDCEAIAGHLPTGSSDEQLGKPCNFHSADEDTYPVGLIILDRMRSPDNLWGCNSTAGGSASAVTDITDCRVFIVDLWVRDRVGSSASFYTPGHVFVNPDVYLVHKDTGQSTLNVISGNASPGPSWVINGEIIIDMCDLSTAVSGSLYYNSTDPLDDCDNQPRFYHTAFHVVGNNTWDHAGDHKPWTFDQRARFADKTTSQNALAVNVLFSAEKIDTTAAKAGLYNSADVLQHCAYHHFLVDAETYSFTNDAGAVILDDQPHKHGRPPRNSPLVGAGTYSGVEYDQEWRPRLMNAPTIGPREIDGVQSRPVVWRNRLHSAHRHTKAFA